MTSSRDGTGSAKHTAVTLAKYVGTLVLGGVIGATTAGFTTDTLNDSSTVVRVSKQVIFSGGELNITGTLTEDDRVGNGTQTGWLIQNPHSEELLVKGVSLYVTTAGETTKVDVSRGTGSIATGTNAATGTTLAEDLTLAAGVHELTGSLLFNDTADSPRSFVLDEYGGDNDYIIIGSTSTQAGSGTVIKYHINAYQFE